ncbi:MAG: AzlC family ABC transporter permease [Beijerinckiaceae bacterium]|jgi:4-azaleucine resistance transporter AzlC
MSEPDLSLQSSQEPQPVSPVYSPVTWTGFWLGMRLTLPLLPGIMVFGAAFGAGAAHKGLSLFEAMLSSGLVFAGAAQLVSLALWQDHWTLGSTLAITLVVFAVNARMILMGAALHHWFKTAAPMWRWFSLYLFTDANWILGVRYHQDGGRDYGMFVGSGVLLWLTWLLVTVPGYLLGSLVPDPKTWGIDLVMPIIFAVMLIPLWKGKQTAWPWLVAAIVSIVVMQMVEGYAFIVVGALAGAIAGALMPEAQPDV